MVKEESSKYHIVTDFSEESQAIRQVIRRVRTGGKSSEYLVSGRVKRARDACRDDTRDSAGKT